MLDRHVLPGIPQEYIDFARGSASTLANAFENNNSVDASIRTFCEIGSTLVNVKEAETIGRYGRLQREFETIAGEIQNGGGVGDVGGDGDAKTVSTLRLP